MPDDVIQSEINVVAWTGTLFVPVLLELVTSEQRSLARLGWLAALLIVVSCVLVTFSKAGVISIVLSVGLWLGFRLVGRTGVLRASMITVVIIFVDEVAAFK